MINSRLLQKSLIISVFVVSFDVFQVVAKFYKQLLFQIFSIKLIINKIIKMAKFFAVWFSKYNLIIFIKKNFVFVYFFVICVSKIQETKKKHYEIIIFAQNCFAKCWIDFKKNLDASD